MWTKLLLPWDRISSCLYVCFLGTLTYSHIRIIMTGAECPPKHRSRVRHGGRRERWRVASSDLSTADRRQCSACACLGGFGNWLPTLEVEKLDVKVGCLAFIENVRVGSTHTAFPQSPLHQGAGASPGPGCQVRPACYLAHPALEVTHLLFGKKKGDYLCVKGVTLLSTLRNIRRTVSMSQRSTSC